MAEDILGKVLNGKYRLLGVLGEGAMGVVYRAEQLDVKGRSLREVALKTLRPALSNDENFARRFLDEVRVAAQLRSAHVVTLYDVGADEDGQLYYTMEFVRGQTLKEVIQRHGPLPAVRVVDIAGQICEALIEAHGLPHPIVHRDLKPANIFVEERRGEDLVKVGDFGIAKILGEQHTHHTAIGTPGPGTPRYMAPEQWKGQELSNRTDLYSLGCLIHELLTATPPFAAHGGGIEALMYQHLTQPPPPLPDTIPRALRTLVERLLAKEPKERPENALIVIQALKTALLDTEEQKTVILASVEEVVPERSAAAEQGNLREERSGPLRLPPHAERAPEVPRPQTPSALLSEASPHQTSVSPRSGKSRRILSMVVIVLGLFFGGRVLFKENTWIPYWPQTEGEQPQEEKKAEGKTSLARQEQPKPEMPTTRNDGSPSTEPDAVARENPPATREIATPDPQNSPLSTEKPPLPQGSLSVAVNVESAKVSLNGAYAGLARNGAPLEIPKVAVGNQDVRVDADGYVSMTYTTNIQDGKLTKLEFPLVRVLEGTPPAPGVPLAAPPQSSPLPRADQKPIIVPPSESEDPPAVIFYGPDGKPIPQSQLEQKRQMRSNQERRGPLSPATARLERRNRRIQRDFPPPRPRLPRNRDDRFSAQ